MKKLGQQKLPCGAWVHETCIAALRRAGICLCPSCHDVHSDLEPVIELFEQCEELLLRDNRRAEAWELAHKIVSLDPQHSGANCVLGDMATEKHNYLEAQEFYKISSLSNNAYGIFALYNLGAFAEQTNDIPKAMQLYHSVRQKCFSDGTVKISAQLPHLQEHLKKISLAATFNLGMLNKKQGRFTEAHDLYMEARLHGQDVALSLGVLLEEMGDLKKARSFYEEAAEKGNMDAQVNLGKLCLDIGDMQQAKRHYEVAHFGGHGDGTACLGFLYFVEGNARKAIDLLEEARAKKSVIAAHKLSVIYRALGDVSKAAALEADFETAAERARIGEPSLCQTEKLPHDLVHPFNIPAGSVASSDYSAQVPPSLGEHVRAHGLTSPTGQALNGLVGVVVEHDLAAGRCGVQFEHVDGIKAIKLANLATFTVRCHESTPPPEKSPTTDPEEEMSVNAQVSDTLLRSTEYYNRRVLLMQFSRSPEAFRKALMHCSDLASVRESLKEHGLPIELQSGAKVFVQPEDYPAVLEAIKLGKWVLHPSDIIVDPALEVSVLQVARNLPRDDAGRRAKVLPRGSQAVPLNFAAKSAELGGVVCQTRTFINIKVPSSSSQQYTKSTTDASTRKIKNHRRGKQYPAQ